MEENSVAAGTRNLVRGTLVVAAILIIIFAALFVYSRSRGGEDHSGKPSASFEFQAQQIT
jgi:hypothetical protein